MTKDGCSCQTYGAWQTHLCLGQERCPGGYHRPFPHTLFLSTVLHVSHRCNETYHVGHAHPLALTRETNSPTDFSFQTGILSTHISHRRTEASPKYHDHRCYHVYHGGLSSNHLPMASVLTSKSSRDPLTSQSSYSKVLATHGAWLLSQPCD